jgi:hypothetical protein
MTLSKELPEHMCGPMHATTAEQKLQPSVSRRNGTSRPRQTSNSAKALVMPLIESLAMASLRPLSARCRRSIAAICCSLQSSSTKDQSPLQSTSPPQWELGKRGPPGCRLQLPLPASGGPLFRFCGGWSVTSPFVGGFRSCCGWWVTSPLMGGFRSCGWWVTSPFVGGLRSCRWWVTSPCLGGLGSCGE